MDNTTTEEQLMKEGTEAQTDVPTELEGSDNDLHETDPGNFPETFGDDKLVPVLIEEISNKEEYHLATGSLTDSSTGRKYKYDREFLLQFQHDTCVSTKPISLPTIPDIIYNRYKTDLRRSEQATRKGTMRNYRSNRDSKKHEKDESPEFETANGSWNEQFPERDKIEYDGTCFIVIDFEGNDEDMELKGSNNGVIDSDDTEIENSASGANGGEDTEIQNSKSGDYGNEEAGMTINRNGTNDGENAEIKSNSISTINDEVINNVKSITGNKQPSTNEKLNSEENKCQTLSTSSTHDIHTRIDDLERKRKRRSSPNYMKNEKCNKRMRRSPAEVSESRYKESNWKMRDNLVESRYHSYNYSRGSRSRGLHYRGGHRYSRFHEVSGLHGSRRLTERKGTPTFDHVKFKQNTGERNNSHIEQIGVAPPRNCPLLYENGKPVDAESRKDNFVVQNQLSPVSDRSISPYADFSGFFKERDTEYETSEKRNSRNSPKSEADVSPNVLMNGNDGRAFQNDWSYPNEAFQNGRAYPEGAFQNGAMFHRNSFSSSVNNIRDFQNHSNFYRIDFPVHPTFHGPMIYPGHQIQNSSFQINNGIRLEKPCSVTERVSIQTEPIQRFHVSKDSINSLSMETQSKIIIAIYRTMVATDRTQFSPEDVIQMLLYGPIRIEFDTKYTLIQLLRQNEDKFIVQNNESIISPKTDIEICHTFTNNPRYKHDCMNLHICKYYLLGNCPWQQCKFSHTLLSSHNTMVLKRYELGGHSENRVKHLIRDLNSRNISTTPLICKFYNNEGGCQKGESCSHLHLCTHFINGDCMFDFKCKRSHDIGEQQPKVILENNGIFLNDFNYDRVVCLLKSTLQHGEVRLKRELSKSTNIDSTVSKEISSFNTSEVPSILVPVSVKKEIELLPSDVTSTDSLECKKSENENEYIKQEVLSSNSHFKERCEKRTNESEYKRYQQKSLPDFIPLETVISMNVERDIDVSVKESINTDVPLIDTTTDGSNLEIISSPKSEFGEHLETDSSEQFEHELSSMNQQKTLEKESKPHSEETISEKALLPTWTPFSLGKKDTDIEKVKGTTTDNETLNSKDDSMKMRFGDDVPPSDQTFIDGKCNIIETDKHNTDSDANEQMEITLEAAETSQHKEDGTEYDDMDHVTSEDISSNLPIEEAEYLNVMDDGMKRNTLMPAVLFEMKNDCRCFRVRKLHDCWQLQVTSISRQEVEDNGRFELTGLQSVDNCAFEESVAPWKDMGTADAEILEKMYHLFTGFVNSKPVENKDC